MTIRASMYKLGSKTFGRIHAFFVNLEVREAERTALKPGTKVSLSRCQCRSADDHKGVWIIDVYNSDVDDYRIKREDESKTTYTHRDAMEVVHIFGEPSP